MLLPFSFLVLAPVPLVHYDTTAALAVRLATDVRAAVDDGWAPSGYVGSDTSVTMVQDGAARRYIVEIDDDGDGGTYRIENDTAPSPAIAADPMMDEMVAAPAGGLELEPECGGWLVTPYVLDDAAKGPRAGQLIASSLRTMSDLDWIELRDGEVVYGIEDASAERVDLHVSIDADGNVLAAELRRHGSSFGDDSTYTRAARLARALRHHTVNAIDGQDALIIDGKRFAIDPHGTAFHRNHPADDEDGCGC